MESLDFKVVFSYIKSLGSRRWSLNSNIVLVTHSPPLSLSLSLSFSLSLSSTRIWFRLRQNHGSVCQLQTRRSGIDLELFGHDPGPNT